MWKICGVLVSVLTIDTARQDLGRNQKDILPGLPGAEMTRHLDLAGYALTRFRTMRDPRHLDMSAASALPFLRKPEAARAISAHLRAKPPDAAHANTPTPLRQQNEEGLPERGIQ